MKRSEVRAFVKAGVDALNKTIPFGSGRITEFNSKRNNQYPAVWLESLEVSPELTDSGLPMDTWSINLHIAQKDSQDSKPEQYEAIVDQCDEIAQKLMNKYNNEIEGYKLASLSAYSRDPFIKRHADNLTGVVLSFTITSPDTTDVCE